MTDTRYSVLAIGNAIVDVIADATDDFLEEQSLEKGSMRLIDEAEAERLYGLMGPGREVSGGSAGNTAAGLAALNGDDAITEAVIDKSLPRLQTISKYGIGLDKINVDYATSKKLPVLFTPGVNHTTVAEHTFGLLLGITKVAFG